MILEERSRGNSTGSDRGYDTLSSTSSQSSLLDVFVSCNYTKLDDEQVEVLLTMGAKSDSTSDLESMQRYVPIRLVLVIDRSSSMQYPPLRKDRGKADKVTKIDSMKLYTELIVKHLLDENDQLAIVTFASDARVEMSLRDMTPEGKNLALKITEGIQPFGATNLSAGIEEAIDLFCREKLTGSRQNYQNCMVIFSDGDANEGITNSAKLINRMIDQMAMMGKGNNVNITTCASGCHRHNLLYRISEEFSSDAFYFIDDASNFELDMLKPIILRKTAVASDIKVYVETHNGVTMNKHIMMSNFMCGDDDNDPYANRSQCTHVEYYVHDLSESMTKHLTCCLNVPYQKIDELNEENAMTVELIYRNLFTNKICKKKIPIPFNKLPQHTLQSTERSLILSGQQKARIAASNCLRTAADLLRRDRSSRQSIRLIHATMDEIQKNCDYINTMIRSNSTYHLTGYIDPLISTLQYCLDLIQRPSKATWAKVKALASSLEREMPTTTSTEQNNLDADLFQSTPITSKLQDLLKDLFNMYEERGLSKQSLENYKSQINQLLYKSCILNQTQSITSCLKIDDDSKRLQFNYDKDGSILI